MLLPFVTFCHELSVTHRHQFPYLPLSPVDAALPWATLPTSGNADRSRNRKSDMATSTLNKNTSGLTHRRSIGFVIAYRHQHEDECCKQVGDSKHANRRADHKTHSRAGHCRQKQRQEELEKLRRVQLESFTATRVVAFQ